MYIDESIRTSLEEIKGHPLRSFFTLIGVMLGTMALVVVLSVLDGVRAAVAQGFADRGMDGVLVARQKTPTDPMERAKLHVSRGLRVEDGVFFRDNDLIEAFAPVGEGSAVVTAGKVTSRVSLYGVTPEFATIKGRRTLAGRFITDRDSNGKAPVCVLGFELEEQLFGAADPIGQRVNLGGRRLTVVGVETKFNMEFIGGNGMPQETRGLYIPFSLYEDMFGKAHAISYVLVKDAAPEKSIEAEDEASKLFAQAHHGIHDVEIENAGKEILEQRGQVSVEMRDWTIVFFSIAGISLLIGGVGIYSVLKISISERLFEIGLRKSLGASDAEIFVQFLIESITLSTVGAAIGGGLGCLLVRLVATKFPAGLPVSMSGLITATTFAVAIGLFAGLYPSTVASRLSPVEALRS